MFGCNFIPGEELQLTDHHGVQAGHLAGLIGLTANAVPVLDSQYAELSKDAKMVEHLPAF